MLESPSQSSVSAFAQGLKAATLGSARGVVADAKSVATGPHDNIPGIVGVLVATAPIVILAPFYFFLKGLLRHTAEALDALPESEACDECGQVDAGQTGEHPCPRCGVPLEHDDPPKAAAAPPEPVVEEAAQARPT